LRSTSNSGANSAEISPGVLQELGEQELQPFVFDPFLLAVAVAEVAPPAELEDVFMAELSPAKSLSVRVVAAIGGGFWSRSRYVCLDCFPS
jgi:hypothetical protein